MTTMMHDPQHDAHVALDGRREPSRRQLACQWHHTAQGRLACTWRHVDPNGAGAFGAARLIWPHRR
jgi:hypothetical protein